MKKDNTRYKLFFRTALHAVPLLLKKYDFQTDHVPELNEPFLMLANHTTEDDYLMAACAARKPMYFVCGEHLLRGRFGKLLQWIGDPITIPKGSSSLPAVKEILRRIRRGDNVMLFPEGSRSFNGETVPVQKSLGKLVKRSGAALVTYRIEGGYFVAPRWAYRFRHGPVKGHVLHTYPAKELRNMSVEEITAIINRDLYENAYATQTETHRLYQGKGLAEGLENYLLLCPKCGAFDSLVTKDNEFRCRCCGLEGKYDEYGFLRGKSLQFHTVYDWGKWIEQRFDQLMSRKKEKELLFTEKNIRLYRIDAEKHQSQDCLETSLSIYPDRLEMGEYCFPFSDISDMAMLYYGKSLLFTCGQGYFGMTGPAFHAWKADRLYRLFKTRKAG